MNTLALVTQLKMITKPVKEHKIRITITSKNCSAIERISNELVKAAKDKSLKVKVIFWPITSPISLNDVDNTYFRVQSVCQQRHWELQPVRHQMVKVPRPGIVTRCEFTNVSSIFNHQLRLSARSLNFRLTLEWMSKSPFATRPHICRTSSKD